MATIETWQNVTGKWILVDGQITADFDNHAFGDGTTVADVDRDAIDIHAWFAGHTGTPTKAVATVPVMVLADADTTTENGTTWVDDEATIVLDPAMVAGLTHLESVVETSSLVTEE